MRLIATVVGAGVIATVVSACSGSSGGSNPNGSGGKVVEGGTFTLAMSADPGKLDPQSSAASNLFQMSQFAYDHLVNTSTDGKIVSGLASAWKLSSTKVILTLHKGITCSDGSPFTAADAAANLNYVANPKNQSPFGSTFLPAGAHATADAAAGTLTMTSPKAAPFVLNGLAGIPLVCAKGMQNRKTLASGTDGTGPYQLTQAVAADHYTFTKRAGYTWGPDGIGTSTKGLPDKIVVKIVQNETTAANLLLSGGLNAAAVVGADAQRLEQAHLFSAKSTVVLGEMWFNQAKGRPTVDKPVREALTQALDLAQIRKVATSGRGAPPTTFANNPPAACQGNSVASALPSHDLVAAGKLLDADGWRKGSDGTRSKAGTPLTLRLVYTTGLGSGVSAAAELAVQVWKKLGVKVTSKGQDDTALTQNVFGAGNWDITWLPVNVNSPDQLIPFLSGAVPPAGTNFAHIDNSDYNAGVAKAATIVGAKGCPAWLSAESALVRDADVVPFANQVAQVFGKKARFDFDGVLVPTSIRMLAG